MRRTLWAALAGLVLLSACGAGEPPTAAGGMDLSGFWRGQ